MKVQEAIKSIQAHGKRIQNLIRNDPVKNKVNKNWKVNIPPRDMLQRESKQTVKNNNGFKKNTNVRTVPIKTNQGSHNPPNQIIKISNVQTDGRSSIRSMFSFKNHRAQQNRAGEFQFSFTFADFKKYFRL